jgi:spore germination protein GerM
MAKKAKSSLGITFWAALLVFLGLLYTANRVDLASIIGNSGSGNIERLFGGDYNSTPNPHPQAADKPDAPAEKPGPSVDVRVERPEPLESKPRVQASAPSAQNENPGRPKPEAQNASPAPVRKAEQTPKTGTAAQPAAAAKPPETPAAAQPVKPAHKIREGILYFIRLSEEGEITLVKTPREIRSSDAPLTDTLRSLAAGPTEKESGAGCTSLIPAGSRLLSVTVRDGVAFVNFDENFRFNSFGREGYDGQIKQLVYTATEFPTIQAVQVLINGNKIDYLGSEGIYIGKPVGRKDV